ncbi:MAG: hydrogenase expression/formation protein HypE [Candidatus Marinimicrobia bacterium]|nr:hydrogenase expression/formation protein HypE [Candidatus Neomarinimicrobiota bacterium]MCF7850777.1 hydrogenase expression/formation protein HypE [Candidatus Neomarinimicrobiota bacterium]MCF7904275.1 hydrogenase expression/formation protein HypE [Candidatus Neomarinimicrobiota bacterium]
MDFPESLSCPVPILSHDTVQLAHGAGGKLSNEMIDKIFLPRFTNTTLEKMEDQAILENPGGRIAFSTDTFVVDPIFFPGGDIGDLAINGTVNDVAMSGAQPLYLSAGFILEEGLPFETLHRIVLSMEKAANIAGIQIVAGDTKVVNRGSCDKLFINTTGFGFVPDGINISASNLKAGDKIILSGTLADHGMAVMTSREGLSFQSTVKSDTAGLNHMVNDMLAVSHDIHALRDPTRGGLATTLNEFAATSNVGIQLEDGKIPVKDDVRGACELLGIDPLYVANEGKLVAVVPPEIADTMLAAMQNNPLGANAVIIGEVTDNHPGVVALRMGLGGNRIVDMTVGEQLPRIC